MISRPMVVFNDVEEWLAELKVEALQRNHTWIARVCTMRRSQGSMAPLFSYHLVAGFLNAQGLLVEAVEYVGDAMLLDKESRVFAKLEEKRVALIAALNEAGVWVRSGRYVLEQKP